MPTVAERPSTTSAPTPVAHEPTLSPPLPRGFREHVLELEWAIAAPRDVVWAYLNDPRTFTRGQLPPWHVEFLPLPDGSPGGFVPGCLNAHHGPFMSFHGVIGDVRAPAYRDLRYSYGSYAVSMRLARPQRLQFFFAADGERRTRVRVRLDTHVRSWFAPIWGGVNRLFWSSFGLSLRLILRVRGRTRT